MKWEDLADQPCSVARTIAIIGDRWTMMIIRDCFNGSRRFDEFQVSLGISRTIVTDRLNLLVEEGVLTKVPYQEKPIRYEYRLTEKGLDLYPILLSMFSWGDRYYATKEGPPLLFRHKTCGHDFHSKVCCSECDQELKPREVEVRAGPGLKKRRARGAQA